MWGVGYVPISKGALSAIPEGLTDIQADSHSLQLFAFPRELGSDVDKLKAGRVEAELHPLDVIS